MRFIFYSSMKVTKETMVILVIFGQSWNHQNIGGASTLNIF